MYKCGRVVPLEFLRRKLYKVLLPEPELHTVTHSAEPLGDALTPPEGLYVSTSHRSSIHLQVPAPDSEPVHLFFQVSYATPLKSF